MEGAKKQKRNLLLDTGKLDLMRICPVVESFQRQGFEVYRQGSFGVCKTCPTNLCMTSIINLIASGTVGGGLSVQPAQKEGKVLFKFQVDLIW